MTCASSCSARPGRRLLKKDIIRDDRNFGCGVNDEVVKPRKRRQSTKPKVSRKEKMVVVSPPPIPHPPPPRIRIVGEDCFNNIDGLLEMILELIMWKNVAKSSFGFGFGSVVSLSSRFSRDFSFSKQKKWTGELKLIEDDVAQGVFSGEPLMTLNVVPVLLFGAKFGHLITPWRLSTTRFFLLFTAPKLFSCYSQQIHKKGQFSDCMSYMSVFII
ncbi:putative reticulon-like protein B17/18/21 [Dioscorea sansibarensis]